MSGISKSRGLYHCCDRWFASADEAYRYFRREYNKKKGKASYEMLNRIGVRTERVHGTWMHFSDGYEFNSYPSDRIRTYMLGLFCSSYCKTVGIWDIPYDVDDPVKWADWFFRKGCQEQKIVGKKLKTGRTSIHKVNRKRKLN